jgi:hypothetical protein
MNNQPGINPAQELECMVKTKSMRKVKMFIQQRITGSRLKKEGLKSNNPLLIW